MNIVYINLVPREIRNSKIHSFLSEFANFPFFLSENVDISIKNVEDMFPGVGSYIEKILKFYCTNDGDGVAGVDAFFKVFNNHLSTDDVKNKKLYLGEDISVYEILDEGFKMEYSFKDSKFVIISGTKYHIPFPYGVASGNVCINCCLEKYSIWHETAHLFGASDHYDEVNHSNTCGDQKCFMQWDSLKGRHFCKKAISEIR
ncbi:MAG: hypothetical protein AAB588_04255 [Patescibacteria group bacterium]